MYITVMLTVKWTGVQPLEDTLGRQHNVHSVTDPVGQHEQKQR